MAATESSEGSPRLTVWGRGEFQSLTCNRGNGLSGSPGANGGDRLVVVIRGFMKGMALFALLYKHPLITSRVGVS